MITRQHAHINSVYGSSQDSNCRAHPLIEASREPYDAEKEQRSNRFRSVLDFGNQTDPKKPMPFLSS